MFRIQGLGFRVGFNGSTPIRSTVGSGAQGSNNIRAIRVYGESSGKESGEPHENL